ncbi:hypothetical protein SEA_EASTWEST_15 [Arthrobacter phage EastWest]|uniref:Uncharacterized protein n=1 Tax=Arthrobacter phage EastWest TaxID=2894292 RepID=A0AAE9C9I6_9CAUD|nr:hypothetical protein SEA_EASTWEST_15 [Arthrobacter phage EastWest]
MSEKARDTERIPQADAQLAQSEVMSKTTTIHNAMSYALIVDSVGHIVGGSETAEIEADAVTHRLINSGELIVIDKKPASRTSDAKKNGDD